MRYWGKTIKLNEDIEEFNPLFFRYLRDRRRIVDPAPIDSIEPTLGHMRDNLSGFESLSPLNFIPDPFVNMLS